MNMHQLQSLLGVGRTKYWHDLIFEKYVMIKFLQWGDGRGIKITPAILWKKIETISKNHFKKKKYLQFHCDQQSVISKPIDTRKLFGSTLE